MVYPFVTPTEVDDGVLARLAAGPRHGARLRLRVPPYRLVRRRRPAGWTPIRSEPFRELIRAVVAAFPAHLPYGGLYGDSVPHLTVGELRLGSAAELAAAERAVRAQLPISARVDQVVLLAGRREAGSWRQVATFELGA